MEILNNICQNSENWDAVITESILLFSSKHWPLKLENKMLNNEFSRLWNIISANFLNGESDMYRSERGTVLAFNQVYKHN